MTFITDLDDLIRHHHGDVKKLREIRDTIRHDNFITTDDKKYVESLITVHLKNQLFAKPSSQQKSDTEIKLQPKHAASSLDQARVGTQQQVGSSIFSSNSWSILSDWTAIDALLANLVVDNIKILIFFALHISVKR